MNFLVIILLTTTAVLNGTQKEQNALARVKQKWLTWADEQVEAKKREFSDQYLNPGDLELLNNPKFRADFSELNDNLTKEHFLPKSG